MEGMEKELVEVTVLRAITRYLDWIRWIGSNQSDQPVRWVIDDEYLLRFINHVVYFHCASVVTLPSLGTLI